MDRAARIEELQKQRDAIDAELAEIKKTMKAEITAAFSKPKKPKKGKPT